MSASLNIITDHLDLWTTAKLPKKKGGRGRGANSKKSPHGIQKLRELILKLAVRGKLVPQDPNDEPASELLKRITSEKAKLIKEGKVKKQKPLSPISADETPYVLPNGWIWVRLAEVGHDWGQKTPDGDFTYIEVSAIDNVSGTVKSPSLLRASEAPSRARKTVQVGTVIYSTVRPYLQNICVIEDEYSPEPIASTAFAILHPLQEMPGRFFAAYLRSPTFINYVESVQTGIAYPAINDKQFFGGVTPLPPVAEQHRIVAKFDELMALCDKLEQEQGESGEAHQQLVETLLGTLTQAKDNAGLEAAWQRIAEHFDTLFTTEASIDQLKQTILQLAVMGKLVPQDPTDEPVSELLKKIATEKERLIKQKKIKKQKSFSPISEEEILFELPHGWKWVRLQEIVHLLGDGLHGTPEYSVNEKYYFVNGNNLKDGVIVIKPETKTVTKDQYDKYKKDLCENTVLVSINGTLGNVAFYNNEDIVLGKSACYFNLAKVIYKHFIKAIIESPGFIEYAFKNATGSTIKNLGLKAMNNLPVALPPSAEQQRIVTKVDELMAICDSLKGELHETKTTQVQLADAIVERAVG